MATRVSDPSRTMRKQPRQSRSRDTVAVIVEAGAQVLARGGWSGFSTNEVASAAGVSIGSIYQYFPNKLVLIDAIRHRHFEQVLRVFDAPSECDKLDDRVAHLIDGMIASHDANPDLHRVLLDEVPKPDSQSADGQTFDLAYREGFKTFVGETAGIEPSPSLELASAVLSAAVEGLVHEAARRDGAAKRDFRDEVVYFVVTYLMEKRGR